jgi:hypothetical protein
MARDVNYRLLASLMLSVGALSCGGGSDDAAAPASAPVQAPAPPPPAPPPPAPPPPPPAPPPIPPMAQPPTDITGTAAQVGIDFWGDNSTANGGKGAPVDGLSCFPSVPQTVHIHSHLAVVLNGQLLAIPNNIGRVFATATQGGCLYQLHNHDAGGRQHIEGPAPFTATLGNWFDIWGQPLARDNVGGITGLPVVFYVTDNGVTVIHDGDPATIELKSHRLITIQIGTQLTELPNFVWTGT